MAAALDPVLSPVGDALEPVAGTVGTDRHPVGDAVGTVIDHVTGTDSPVAATLAPQTPAGMGTLADELAAGSAPSAAASAIAPSPLAGVGSAAGIITGLAALVVAFSTALIASDSSRAPPTRFASEASSANSCLSLIRA